MLTLIPDLLCKLWQACGCDCLAVPLVFFVRDMERNLSGKIGGNFRLQHLPGSVEDNVTTLAAGNAAKDQDILEVMKSA